jgi:GLPGLI family protein
MKSKSLILLCFLLIGFHPLFSQQLTGRAHYKASNQIMIRIDSAAMSPEEIAEAHEIMKKPWQRGFILTFSQTESNWKQAETLAGDTDHTSDDGMTISLAGSGNEILYKNLIDQRFIQEQEFMGRDFLIQDALEVFDWEMTEETKKIGDYSVQKAIYNRIVDSRRFSEGMAEMEHVKDTIQVTVWFTAQIPVAHGPENYFGLPGLILEVHNGGRAFYFEKIELNPISNPVKIVRPKLGKVVNSEDFRSIQEESMQEMINRYQGKPGEGNKIRIGG